MKDSAAELVAVEITVVSEPAARPLRKRVAAIHLPVHVITALVLGAAVLGMALALSGVGGGGRKVTSGLARADGPSAARAPGPAGVAAAYGYPLACLSITILASDRTYARADLNHVSPCGRFVGFSTAIFHRAMGAWRRALDAVSYSCPVASIPAAVQTELGVCLPPGARRSTGR